MTTQEFKNNNLIQVLKDNNIFLADYSGPLDFNEIDPDYNNIYNRYKEDFYTFKEFYNTITNYGNLSEEMLVKVYYQACNGFYNKVFTGSSKKTYPISCIDVLEILTLFDNIDGTMSFSRVFKLLLKIKCKTEFIKEHFWTRESLAAADIYCPENTSEQLLKKVASICWNESMKFYVDRS